MPTSNPPLALWPHVVLAALLAGALRLTDLGGQLLLGDEWHALHVAALLDYGGLATYLTAGATSIPSNLHARLLLDTVGWSEWTLRLPSVIAGVGLVAGAPLLLRRAVGPWCAAATGYLLAVSPLLVFFSRFARPYSVAVLLVVVSLLAAHRWAQDGRKGAAGLFMGTAVLAGYVHVLEARILYLALGALLLRALLGRRIPELRCALRVRSLLLVGAVASLTLALLLLPAALATGERFTTILERARPAAGDVLDALVLLAGTRRAIALAAVAPLLLLGLVHLVRRAPSLALLFAVVAVGCLASVLVAHPVDSDVAIVFARYCLPLIPLGCVAVASGAELLVRGLARRLAGRAAATGLRHVACVAPGVALLALGPLPGLLGRTNSFAEHRAYHVSYEPVEDGARRFARFLREAHFRGPPADVRTSSFYRELAAEPGDFAVIEYPVPVGDMFSTHFVQQEVHGKRVLGGYFRRPLDRSGPIPGLVRANALVDDVLAVVRDPAALRFATLVDLADPEALRASGARYLVLHLDLFAEQQGLAPADSGPSELTRYFEEQLGPPVHADPWIVVHELGLR